MPIKTGRAGGIDERVKPAPRPPRPASHGNRLSIEDRVVIQVRLADGWSIARIAGEVGMHPTTISREITRGSVQGRYWARFAQERADRARSRAGYRKLTHHGDLRRAVIAGLNQHFSPRQISHRLRRDHPDRHDMRVSHETIYQALYVQGRGALRQELRVETALRSGRKTRLPASRLPPKPGRPWLAGCHISQRPAEAEDRAVPGHWEGDLVLGAGHKSALITLVERSTRFVLIQRLDQYDSATVTDQLIAMMAGLPAALRRSLTWDQGSEMAQHARFTLASNVKVYFCDPHSPWQRGSNENTNGLIRFFHPKGTDFTAVTDEHIARTQHLLNIRPRQTLNWATPAEQLNEYLTALTT
ncbi:IS30 family transposase [Enemella sp. A6]|uniref:IS30 family transposase n=1 Tax=Enemella sp. A6 TaxID=3440152 RepID=UPI003EBF5CCC